jgi:hypothetical protein
MPSIRDFIANINGADLARPNRFTSLITYPKLVNRIGTTVTCEAAELPGITYTTTEQKFGSNPIEKFPYHVQFNDVNLTFIVTEGMGIKNAMNDWMNLISPNTGYNFNYKTGKDGDGYAGTITITQYSTSDVPIHQVKLIDAYPISVNQLDLDWSSEGYHKLTVVFAYTYWERTTGSIGGNISGSLLSR